MSLVLAGREGVMPAALPRGAVALVLLLAVGLHLAGGAAVYWAAPDPGTMADGQGGLTVGLGPAGAAPGAVETATPPEVPPVETDAATEQVAPPPVQEVPSETVPEAEAAAASVPAVAPQPATVDSVDLAESVDPVVAPSVTPSVPDETTAQPDASAEIILDKAPEVAPPDTVTATAPQEGLGVSRRPASRPHSVEEAARQARPRASSAAPQRPRATPKSPHPSAAAPPVSRAGAARRKAARAAAAMARRVVAAPVRVPISPRVSPRVLRGPSNIRAARSAPGSKAPARSGFA